MITTLTRVKYALIMLFYLACIITCSAVLCYRAAQNWMIGREGKIAKAVVQNVEQCESRGPKGMRIRRWKHQISYDGNTTWIYSLSDKYEKRTELTVVYAPHRPDFCEVYKEKKDLKDYFADWWPLLLVIPIVEFGKATIRLLKKGILRGESVDVRV